MKPQSVSDVVNSIKDLLEGTFYSITVEGEVSNLSSSGAGHYYFSLSDENASISCALFKMDAFRNPIIRKTKNGDKIVVTGPISVYSKRGTFQLLAKKITPQGLGDLSVQFAKLKEKLQAQGYFNVEHKLAIPQYISRLAVITALQGAALQDFLNIMQRRCMWYEIVIIPALVQGDAAPESLIRALNKAIKLDRLELIVFTRGGGSMEDLWAFNSEELVKAIYDCKIPVISAVGHQIDITLCDLVADMRCETPSAAAEVISQHQKELKQKLRYLSLSLKNQISIASNMIHRRIEAVNPRMMLEIVRRRFSIYSQRLGRLDIRGKLYDLTRMHESYQYLDELQLRLVGQIKQNYSNLNHRVEMNSRLLVGMNPNNVLKRGYSYLKTTDGKEVVTSAKKFNTLKEGTSIDIVFADGIGEVAKGRSK